MPAVLADALAEQARLGATPTTTRRWRSGPSTACGWGWCESLEALAALGTGDAEQDARLLAAARRRRASGARRPPARRRAELGDGFDGLGERARRSRSTRRPPTPAAPAAPAAGPTPAGGASRRPSARSSRLAVEGLSNPEIGARLFMSRSTVKTHLSHVYAKLGVANRTELAAISAQQGA